MNNTSILKNHQYSTCIESYIECIMVCKIRCTECINMRVKPKIKCLLRYIRMCKDCANMCRITCMMVYRGSECVKQMCNMCTDMCETGVQ